MDKKQMMTQTISNVWWAPKGENPFSASASVALSASTLTLMLYLTCNQLTFSTIF